MISSCIVVGVRRPIAETSTWGLLSGRTASDPSRSHNNIPSGQLLSYVQTSFDRGVSEWVLLAATWVFRPGIAGPQAAFLLPRLKLFISAANLLVMAVFPTL